MVTENWIAKKLGAPAVPRVSFANVYIVGSRFTKKEAVVGGHYDSREVAYDVGAGASYRLRITWKD